MTSYRLKELHTAESDGDSEVTMDVTGPSNDVRRLFFRASGHRLTWREESFVLSGLIAAMARGHRLEVPGRLDSTFVQGVQRAQTILGDWVPCLKNAPIEVDGGSMIGAVDRDLAMIPASKPPAMTFFSGGVDSFFSLYGNLDSLSALVFVAGFSPTLADVDRCQRAVASAREVASALGKQLIVVTTNLRDFMEEMTPSTPSLSAWELVHGTALAAVAHLAAAEGGRVLVPASFCHEEEMTPWGSHPLLDPLWSSSRVSLQSDGYWANRHRKIEYISQHQLALDHLVVCFRRRDSSFLNCGSCEKCLRTMVSLLACGALDRCSTFEQALDADAVASLNVSKPVGLYAHEFNLRILEERGIRPDIQKALREVIRRAHNGEGRWQLLIRLGNRIRGNRA